MPRVTPRQLGQAAANAVMRKARAANLGQVLVTQAKRRIQNKGDTTTTYPDLWEHPESYRKGGEPLHDTGRLMASLTSTQKVRGNRIELRLATPLQYALHHQFGFKTDGPNFIPLTRKAARTHRNGANPIEEGLERGVDFIMAWKGVTIPQRKIYNMPPENQAEIKHTIATAMK